MGFRLNWLLFIALVVMSVHNGLSAHVSAGGKPEARENVVRAKELLSPVTRLCCCWGWPKCCGYNACIKGGEIETVNIV